MSDTPTCPLVQFIDSEARAFRARATPESDFLARQLEQLAQLVIWTGATTGEQHEDRFEAWEQTIREDHEQRGYHAGYEAGFAAGRLEGNRAGIEHVLSLADRVVGRHRRDDLAALR